MARRYVPRTYNNRRVLRFLAGGLTVLVLTFLILFLILFFVFQQYVVDGQLLVPWLYELPEQTDDTGDDGDGDDAQDDELQPDDVDDGDLPAGDLQDDERPPIDSPSGNLQLE